MFRGSSPEQLPDTPIVSLIRAEIELQKFVPRNRLEKILIILGQPWQARSPEASRRWLEDLEGLNPQIDLAPSDYEYQARIKFGSGKRGNNIQIHVDLEKGMDLDYSLKLPFGKIPQFEYELKEEEMFGAAPLVHLKGQPNEAHLRRILILTQSHIRPS